MQDCNVRTISELGKHEDRVLLAVVTKHVREGLVEVVALDHHPAECGQKREVKEGSNGGTRPALDIRT